MKVVEHFNLVLRDWPSPSLRQQVDVVLENLAQVGVRVSDAELVRWPAFEQSVAAQPKLEKCGDRTGSFVSERHLREKTPAVFSASFDDVLPKDVID